MIAVVDTIVSLYNFNKQKLVIHASSETATTGAMKNHIKKQWHLTSIMLFVAVLDLGLVVTLNFLVALGSVLSKQGFIGLYAWSWQIISLRSFLNVFIYIGWN